MKGKDPRDPFGLRSTTFVEDPPMPAMPGRARKVWEGGANESAVLKFANVLAAASDPCTLY